ncbi:rhodanese-like domain-containing protein [Rubrolithibacter danxiaensis]|uniref:rhodanese-like domain-containing protein n=1 Tax=Rubrolithibacter danxiaensis TaxID=3390805 RepID=UPI003BF884D2
MKNRFIFLLFSFLILTASIAIAQTIPTLQAPHQHDPWTAEDLIEPSQLAALMKDDKAAKPLIFNIGQVNAIKGARSTGPVKEAQNLEDFKKTLQSLSKETPIVFYCGCCPFGKCPNIRPAFKAVKELGFTNAHLLNLPTNIKVDWIEKGYPLEQEGAN